MTLSFTKDEQVKFEAALKEIHFHSNFGFFNSVRCPRRENLHLLIAGTGAGKSTVVRSILRDLLFHKQNNPIIAVWLSEETVEEYRAMFSIGVPAVERLLNTNAYSEQDNMNATEMHFFEWIDMIHPDILIFDNITTSKLYEGKRPADQATFSAKLKHALKKNNCAGIIVAHADSQQTNQKGGLLDVNNIRGSKTICNLAEFAYLLQTFDTPKAKYTTIRIAKSRSQDIIHPIYILDYHPQTKSYVKDTAITFEKFKEAFNERHRL
jgi:KaiC/GvpD/RAD55 family RecA-like ATPase